MAQEEKGGGAVKSSGWFFLAISWGFIIYLSAFSFYKIFTKNRIE